jgi:perosamine synthetase
MEAARPTTDASNQPRREVPFYQPDVGEEEIQAVTETLRSGWLTVGPRTLEFEQTFAAAVDAPLAIGVNSCTAALHLALDSLCLAPDDEVITTSLTFTATGATIFHAGGRPVLADCCPETYNIDPADVVRKITSRTRAIVPVHFAGHPAAMDEILAIAREHRLVVIEDAAHAVPASYRGRKVGSIGDMTAFSFYATKNLTTGEGGMLTLADAEVADRIRMRRLHGMSRDAWKRYSSVGSWRYDVSSAGFKYNMTDAAASMGLVQLRRLPEMHARRLQIAALYTSLLGDCEEIELQTIRPDVESGWHLFVVRVRPERLRIDRDELIEGMKAEGVGTSVHFIPLHMHSFYRRALGVRDEDLPVATAIGNSIFSLPFYTRMSDADVVYVADALKRVIGAERR